MSDKFDDENKKYVQSFGGKGSLTHTPKKKLAIVTCMDCRIDPAAALGIKEGDAHIIRNAGGAAKGAISSLIISQQVLHTVEIAIIHHTECGMLNGDNAKLHAMLKERFPHANTATIDALDFHPFLNLEQSVKDDIAYLKGHELINKDTVISGWVYHVETGKINPVV